MMMMLLLLLMMMMMIMMMMMTILEAHRSSLTLTHEHIYCCLQRHAEVYRLLHMNMFIGFFRGAQKFIDCYT
jgi:hypothetical protein